MSQLAERYAESLLSLALDENKVVLYQEQVDFIKQVFDMANVKTFFASNKIEKEIKKQLLKDNFRGKIETYVLNFLLVLVDKNRISYYDEIFEEFHHLCNEELDIKEGIIESVRPIDKDLLEKLANLLGDGKKIELKQKINKSLISGFRVSIDGMVIDNTMKQKIVKMEEMLKRKDGNLWS